MREGAGGGGEAGRGAVGTVAIGQVEAGRVAVSEFAVGRVAISKAAVGNVVVSGGGAAGGVAVSKAASPVEVGGVVFGRVGARGFDAGARVYLDQRSAASSPSRAVCRVRGKLRVS